MTSDLPTYYEIKAEDLPLDGQFHEERDKVKKIEICVFSLEIDCLNTKLSYVCLEKHILHVLANLLS